MGGGLEAVCDQCPLPPGEGQGEGLLMLIDAVTTQ